MCTHFEWEIKLVFFLPAPTNKQSIASVKSLKQQFHLGSCKYLSKSCEKRTLLSTVICYELNEFAKCVSHSTHFLDYTVRSALTQTVLSTRS